MTGNLFEKKLSQKNKRLESKPVCKGFLPGMFFGWLFHKSHKSRPFEDHKVQT